MFQQILVIDLFMNEKAKQDKKSATYPNSLIESDNGNWLPPCGGPIVLRHYFSIVLPLTFHRYYKY